MDWPLALAHASRGRGWNKPAHEGLQIRSIPDTWWKPEEFPAPARGPFRGGDRLAWRHWRACLRGLATPSPDTQQQGLHCISFRLGPLAVAKWNAGSFEFVRDATSRADPRYRDCVVALLVLRGSLRGAAGDAAIDLGRGDIGLLELDRDARLSTSDSSVLGLLVPRRLVQGRIHGVVLRESQLPCRMLTRHLQRMVLSLPVSGATQVAAMAHAAVAVLQLCVEFTPASHASEAMAELREAVLACIDEELEDASLGPTVLAERLGVSRTLLYRAFAGHGGIQRCIREKRLDAAFRDLRDHPGQRIIDVAFRWGFSSERQFQRAFHARFQLTPSAAKSGEVPAQGPLPAGLPAA